MTETQRNFLILGLIALVGVVFSGAFGSIAGGAMGIVNLLFLVAIIVFLVQLRTRRAGSIALINMPWRVLLDVFAVGAILVFATGLGFPGYAGWASSGALQALLFFVLMAGCIAGAWYSWNQRPYRW